MVERSESTQLWRPPQVVLPVPIERNTMLKEIAHRAGVRALSSGAGKTESDSLNEHA